MILEGGHVSASYYFISEILEFLLPKLRNFGMYKRPEIPEFENSGIANFALTNHA